MAKKKSTKKKTTKKKVIKKKVAKKKKTKIKQNTAFMKAMKPSDALASIIGPKALPRTQVIKKIWDYIKKHDLQNPKNRRNILSDEKLKRLSGKREFSMFDLAKIINNNLS